MIEFFKQFPSVLAIISEKKDGSMKLVSDAIIERQNRSNRISFFKKNGIDEKLAVFGDLTHGSNVEIIDDSDLRTIAATDGLITNRKGIVLAVTVADCVPIFFFEKEERIVGLAHAGWKGIAENISIRVVEKILQSGGEIENLQVVLGPAIGGCHFEIKEDILARFTDHEDCILQRGGKIFVDLKGILKKQLRSAGIRAENIQIDETCTYCSSELFSYRRDKPKTTEAMVAIISLL